MDAQERCSHPEMGRCEGGEIDRLELGEPAPGVQEADGVSPYQAPEGVADDAELLDLLAFLRESA